MVTQRNIAKYVRQVGKGYPVPYRRRLTNELQNNLSEFFEDNPEPTMEEIQKHFGSPERFADEYLLALDETKRRNILHKARWFRKAVCIGMATAILIITVAAIWIVHENSQHVAYYYYEEFHEIE